MYIGVRRGLKLLKAERVEVRVELPDDVINAPTPSNSRDTGSNLVIFCKLTSDNIKGSTPIPSYTTYPELFLPFL